MSINTDITLDTAITIFITIISVVAAYLKLDNNVKTLNKKTDDFEDMIGDVKLEVKKDLSLMVRNLEKEYLEKKEDVYAKLNKIENEIIKITERIEKDFGNKLKDNITEVNNKLNILFKKYDSITEELKEIEKNDIELKTKISHLGEAVSYLKDNKEIFTDYKVLRKLVDINIDDLKTTKTNLKDEIRLIKQSLDSLKETIIRIRNTN